MSFAIGGIGAYLPSYSYQPQYNRVVSGAPEDIRTDFDLPDMDIPEEQVFPTDAIPETDRQEPVLRIKEPEQAEGQNRDAMKREHSTVQADLFELQNFMWGFSPRRITDIPA